MPALRKIISISRQPLGFFLASFTALVYTPIFLLYTSEEKTQDTFTLSSFVPFFALPLAALLFSFILHRFFPRFSRIFNGILTGLALYLLLTVIFFPVQAGILNGKATPIAGVDQALHLGLLAACLLFGALDTLLPRLKHLCGKITLLLGGFALIAAIYMGVNVLSLSEHASWKSATGLSPQRNIIVICLDMVQQEFARQYFAQNPQAEKDFDGFVFFRNTASAAPATMLSYSSTFRGGMFTGAVQDIDPKNNLLNDLLLQGYSISIPKGFKRLMLGDLPGVMGLSKVSDSKAMMLFISGVSRYLPATNIFLRKGFGWESKLEHRKLLQDLIDSLHIDKSLGPHLLWYHTLQTHCPVALTATGEYSENLNADDIHGEIADAFGMLNVMLRKLKRLGVYDDSLIFILSDHGSAILRDMKTLREDQLYLLAPANSSKVPFTIGNYQPTIIIKPPKAHGVLQYSDSAASLLDLRLTLNEFVAPGNSAAYYGLNLLNFTHNPVERRVPFFKFTGDKLVKSNYWSTDGWEESELRLPLADNYQPDVQSALNALRAFKDALERYHKDTGTYPMTEGFISLIGDGEQDAAWAKALFPKYIAAMPNLPYKNALSDSQYLYKSNGKDYKIIYTNAIEISMITRNHPELLDLRRQEAYGYWTKAAEKW